MPKIVSPLFFIIFGFALGFFVAHQREKGWKNGEYKINEISAKTVVEAHKSKDTDKINKIDLIIKNYDGIDDG